MALSSNTRVPVCIKFILARARHLLVDINKMQSCEFIAYDLMRIVNINLFDSYYYLQRNPVLLPSVPVISSDTD